MNVYQIIYRLAKTESFSLQLDNFQVFSHKAKVI
jgi:hypothetical protein